MELHSSPAAAAKKLWSFLRAALLMLRKGLMSKRKLALDLNLMMMKKRGKLLRRTLANLNVMLHSKPTLPSPSPDNCYQFSCTSTPMDPVFFHGSGASRMLAMNMMDYSPQCCAPGEMPTPLPSPFSVRVSNFSTEEESGEVDKQAEAFIKRFHEQLRSQVPIESLMEEYREEEEES